MSLDTWNIIVFDAPHGIHDDNLQLAPSIRQLFYFAQKVMIFSRHIFSENMADCKSARVWNSDSISRI